MDPSVLATVTARALALMFSATAPALPRPADVARVASVEVRALVSSQPTYTAAYYRRLAIHRGASYALVPLFVVQYIAGQRLYANSNEAPVWAKVGHRIGATGVAAMFATNLVTGVPNLIAGRTDPRDRGRRIFHATMMLAASAGFTATGLLSERAESSPEDRDLHRNVALASVAVSTIGYVSMLDWFRRE